MNISYSEVLELIELLKKDFNYQYDAKRLEEDIDIHNAKMVFETFIYEQNPKLIDILYKKPLEDMPLYINDKFFKIFAEWRLKKGK